MIRVALVDEHPVVCDAIKALLAGADDIEVTFTATSIEEMKRKNIDDPVHVSLLVKYKPDVRDAEEVKQLMQRFPRIKVLIMSMYNDEPFILKMIKAGANGHLARDTNRSEMLEAIYTLRNGFEYYAKTITNILLSSYLSDKDIDNTEKEKRQKDLSTREMEVLKLFAEGQSNRFIAEKLFISVRTVETHKNNIMKKINLKTTVDLVKFAIKNNIIKLE